MTRKEQRIGADGEALARSILASFGICQIEKIGTPVRQVKGRVIYGEPVAADFRAVIPSRYGTPRIGRSVMIEVKTVEHNLRWSDFREHQPGKLTEHAELGGLSLVVWVHSSGVYTLEWPIADFGPGEGLTPERARQYTW